MGGKRARRVNWIFILLTDVYFNLVVKKNLRIMFYNTTKIHFGLKWETKFRNHDLNYMKWG